MLGPAPRRCGANADSECRPRRNSLDRAEHAAKLPSSAGPALVNRRRDEGAEARLVVEHAFAMCGDLGIEKALVHADPRDIAVVEQWRGSITVLWLTSDGGDFPIAEDAQNIIVSVPGVPMGRTSQLHLGLFLAVANQHVGRNETVLFLSGGAGSARLDSILITNPGRDYPWFGGKRLTTQHAVFGSHEFARVLQIALRLATEGREGKPIGTIFVLGDVDELEPYLKQMVLNPCRGHTRRKRSIHQDAIIETIREFAAMDGAFVIDSRGVVESAGTYLDAPAKKVKLEMGLGARHAAAAAITLVTSAVAVAISESSSAVTVFQGGRPLLTLDKA